MSLDDHPFTFETTLIILQAIIPQTYSLLSVECVNPHLDDLTEHQLCIGHRITENQESEDLIINLEKEAIT